MNILYGIQGTGNGHIAKAPTILSILKKYSSNVDILLSSNNYSLKPSFNIVYKKKGITFFTKNGRINYLKTLKDFNISRFKKDINNIDFNNYDLIVSDFEPITSWGAKQNNVPSIQISHQASFKYLESPRPFFKNFIGETILNNYCSCIENIGIHYKQYNKNISEPIINDTLKNVKINEKNHITVYLPWVLESQLIKELSKEKKLEFHIFSKNISKIKRYGKIFIFPVNKLSFIESISNSYGVICNTGFVTTSEAMYLGKRLLVIPVKGQYEQKCNTVALNEFGIKSQLKLNINSIDFKKFLNSSPKKYFFNHNIEEIFLRKLNKLQI